MAPEQKLFHGNFLFPGSVERLLVAGAQFCFISLLPAFFSVFCGSRAEVISRQFLFPDSVERLYISSSLFLCNTVKFIVMQKRLLVVVFMALLLTTENLVLRDVKITFQQDFIKLMIMSRSDFH